MNNRFQLLLEKLDPYGWNFETRLGKIVHIAILLPASIFCLIVLGLWILIAFICAAFEHFREKYDKRNLPFS